VLSPEAYNRSSGLAVLCPITSRIKGYPFEVPLEADGPITGVALVDQVRSLDWRIRQASLAGRTFPGTMAEVRAKLATLLGL
jgi:mRNA interferase MazF